MCLNYILQVRMFVSTSNPQAATEEAYGVVMPLPTSPLAEVFRTDHAVVVYLKYYKSDPQNFDLLWDYYLCLQLICVVTNNSDLINMLICIVTEKTINC